MLPTFNLKNEIDDFLNHWESKVESFQNNPKNIPNGLISKETKELFVKYNFVPELANLKNKTEIQYSEIISKQEEMRKKVRGWAGELG